MKGMLLLAFLWIIIFNAVQLSRFVQLLRISTWHRQGSNPGFCPANGQLLRPQPVFLFFSPFTECQLLSGFGESLARYSCFALPRFEVKANQLETLSPLKLQVLWLHEWRTKSRLWEKSINAVSVLDMRLCSSHRPVIAKSVLFVQSHTLAHTFAELIHWLFPLISYKVLGLTWRLKAFLYRSLFIVAPYRLILY